MEKNIIEKLKQAKLLGRSGSCFPVGLKWEMVKKAKAAKKYIICNASEGEPDVFKDKFILENYPEEVVEGIKIALRTMGRNSSAYIYLNKDYYPEFKEKLEKIIGSQPITIFKKPEGYIAGEETSAMEAIEGRKPEPRIKPPYPNEFGLFGYPTLVNNVETFYYVAKIAEEEYKNTRFYCVSGDAKNRGVFELPENRTIERVLKETKNWPDFDFFAQIGGGAGGEIMLPEELDKPISGLASIIIFDRQKTDLYALMEKWADFFHYGNCDKCVPCREGAFRISQMIKNRKLDRDQLEDIFFVLEKTSFCPLGRGIPLPFKSLISKVLNGKN